MNIRRLSLAVFLLLVISCSFLVVVTETLSAQTQQPITIDDIPTPRPAGWITDLTGTVSEEAVEHINMACQEINDRLKREMCVVVVSTIGGPSKPGKNSAHRQFGKNLFNLWGVGKPGLPMMSGVWKDNGVLLFVAIDDKAAEILLGDGIDGREEERIANQIMQNVVIENFRNGDYNSGLYEGIRTCGTRIFSVADLDAPPMLPSVSLSGQRLLNDDRRHKPRGPITWLPWILGGGVFGGLGLLMGGRYYIRYRPRQCPKCKNEMSLLEETQDDEFLEEPQQIEERIGSVDYDVWGCARCKEILKLRYGKLFTRFSKCPKCWYITVLQVRKVIRYANYTVGGKVRVVEDCKSCSYSHDYTYLTPKKVKSSGSSSGFSGGSSSSGFSGGSSSGGGASGRW